MTTASHRDQLIGMLAEAAEIEHCLMCSYLYAAFSLKQGRDEDLQEHELAAVRRWRGEIVGIATEEMLHLALVNNLLIALGARTHFRRFNFPVAAGLFPADVAVALAPLDRATLDHFIYLERPRDADEHDGADIDKLPYVRSELQGRLTDANGDYDTVGELYQSIEASLVALAAGMGEAALLVGPLSAQLSEQDVFLPGLCTIGSVADALRALELIVTQGEGSNSCNEQSHYARFRTIRSQWEVLADQRPGFCPHRPAARDPIMRAPVVSGQRVQVVAEPASSLLDAGNAAYVLMLRLLALISDAQPALLPRPAVMAQAMTLMHAVADIGAALTALPANPAHPGVHAGLTFTVSRTALGYQSPLSAALLIGERLEQFAAHAQRLVSALPALGLLAPTLRGYAAAWTMAAQDGRQPAYPLPRAPQPLPQAQPEQLAQARAPTLAHGQATPQAQQEAAGAPPPPDGDIVQFIRGKDVTIRFEARRCVHSRHCVLGEPEVFVANQPGDWIYPDRATPERIAYVAQNCVSGAIQLVRHDGQPDEAPPRVNLVRVRENGPLALHGELLLAAPSAAPGPAASREADHVPELRLTLCRCGQSARKPYCDGSHASTGFEASGEAPTRPSQVLEWRDGPLTVTPLRDGPLDVRGAAEICSGTGRTLDRTMAVRLCRCGQSKDKPFCDSSHRAAGFEAAGR